MLTPPSDYEVQILSSTIVLEGSIRLSLRVNVIVISYLYRAVSTTGVAPNQALIRPVSNRPVS